MGSERYGTSVMSDEEVMLFAESAMRTGATDARQIMTDIRIIDTLLHAERYNILCGPVTKKTRAGHYRRGSEFFYTMEKIIDGAVEGSFDY